MNLLDHWFGLFESLFQYVEKNGIINSELILFVILVESKKCAFLICVNYQVKNNLLISAIKI